jgi:predicted nucleic acid-binding protein
VIVVSDASPLISLAVTGHLELLKHLYGKVDKIPGYPFGSPESSVFEIVEDGV